MKTTVAALLMIVSLGAYAQHREFARERFHTPHWVFDDRFHHDHFAKVGTDLTGDGRLNVYSVGVGYRF